MREPDPVDYLDLDNTEVELVQIAAPVLCEAVAVILLIGCGLVWMIIAATPVPL